MCRYISSRFIYCKILRLDREMRGKVRGIQGCRSITSIVFQHIVDTNLNCCQLRYLIGTKVTKLEYVECSQHCYSFAVTILRFPEVIICISSSPDTIGNGLVRCLRNYFACVFHTFYLTFSFF